MAHVLIIDDEAGLREMLSRLLEKAGHSVRTAANGVEGLRCHRERPAHVVITDIMMPEKDGLETIREMKRHEPAVPIIAITGNAIAQDVGVLDYATEFGADRTFTKPLDIHALLEAVSELTD